MPKDFARSPTCEAGDGIRCFCTPTNYKDPAIKIFSEKVLNLGGGFFGGSRCFKQKTSSNRSFLGTPFLPFTKPVVFLRWYTIFSPHKPYAWLRKTGSGARLRQRGGTLRGDRGECGLGTSNWALSGNATLGGAFICFFSITFRERLIPND